MKHFIHSPAWLKLKKQLADDRADLVNQLINQRGHDESMVTRGQILMIDEILERYPVTLGDKEED
jgi:hypothetical protein